MSTLASLFDEKHPAGGRPKAWLFLVHPGPVLLVTVVAAGAVALVERQHPSGPDIGRTGLLMLGAQVAIGALNDWADAPADATAQPYKPIARGIVPRAAALVVAAAGAAVALVVGGLWGPGPLLSAALGLGAGVAYDLGLKHSPLSPLCWWAGFVALALLVTLVSGAGGVGTTLPLGVLVATAMLLANQLTGANGDAAAGDGNIAAVLGQVGARRALSVALLAAAVVALLGFEGGAAGRLGALAAGALAVAAAVAAWVPPRALFAATAPLCALAALAWFAGLPAP